MVLEKDRLLECEYEVRIVHVLGDSTTHPVTKRYQNEYKNPYVPYIPYISEHPRGGTGFSN